MAYGRKLRSAAAVLLVSGLLAACDPPPVRHLALTPEGLVMDLPQDWQLQRAEGQTLLFARPVEAGTPIAGAYLLLVRHPQRQSGAPVTLESYAKFSEQQARQFALGYERTENTATEVSGRPALRQLRHWRGPTRERSELALMWIADGYGYQLTAVSGPGNFSRLRPQYERVIRSLHLSVP